MSATALDPKHFTYPADYVDAVLGQTVPKRAGMARREIADLTVNSTMEWLLAAGKLEADRKAPPKC